MEDLLTGVFVCSIPLICLWGALCVLCIGGLLFSRREKHPELTEQELLDAQIPPPSITWRRPAWWVLAFFIWPVFVALALDHWWQRRK